MKKFILVLGVLAVLCVFFVRHSYVESERDSGNNKESSEEIEEKVKLDDMTLEEKIGQMLMVSYSGTFLSEDIKYDLETYKPGGVTLFYNNLSNYSDTLNFINDIKKSSEIPIFIGVDQEGGLVQRIDSSKFSMVSDIPSMGDVSLVNDLEVTRKLGFVMAKELRLFGVNMDFAPVVDVLDSLDNSVIGDRSFGTDKAVVSSQARVISDELRKEGIISVYKHFPGHGSAVLDSHFDLPLISKSKEELMSNDLVPYIDAINQDSIDVIMVGHLSVPSLDSSNTPASLSKSIINDFLKEELGFKGVVVTDALNMGALVNNYGEKEVLELAINAGVDIILMPSSAQEAIRLIKESISEGKISVERIDESVSKILDLKKKYEGFSNTSLDYVNSEEFQSIKNDVFNRIKEAD